MLSDGANRFTKDDIDFCLKKIGKEFRKLNESKMMAEIILIGGTWHKRTFVHLAFSIYETELLTPEFYHIKNP